MPAMMSGRSNSVLCLLKYSSSCFIARFRVALFPSSNGPPMCLLSLFSTAALFFCFANYINTVCLRHCQGQGYRRVIDKVEL